MTKVFISYSKKDRPFVIELEKFLASEGIEVWRDEKNLQVGDLIVDTISTAIESSDYIIAVLSKSSVNSKWVERELSWATIKEQEHGKVLVLPIVIEECDIPFYLKDKHFIKFEFETSEPLSGLEASNKLIDKILVADLDGVCPFCKFDLPIGFYDCPHCGRVAATPNVRAVRLPNEREALELRYIEAIKDAEARGCLAVVRQFESATSQSKAVVNRPLLDVLRLADDENEILKTYYQLRNDSGDKLEDRWDSFRQLSDSLLFTGYSDQIRFATLSLNGKGLIKYGECSLVLRNELIAHRTSVMQENSVIFVNRNKIMSRDELPHGYRASWRDRGKLCVAKSARTITSNTKPKDFQDLILHDGETSAEDDFIEVHVCGSLTIRAVEKVIVSSTAKTKKERLIRKALSFALREKLDTLRKKLDRFGIEVEIA